MIMKILKIYKNEGIKGVMHRIRNRIHSQKETNIQKNNINEFYSFIENCVKDEKEEFNLENTNIIINWVLPPFGPGSGGHINIMRFINYLEKKGISNRVYLYARFGGETQESLKQFAIDYYDLNQNSNTEFYPHTDYMDYSHITIASSWESAYFVRSFGKTKHKVYFVQDFEPEFFPKSSSYFFAENTYKFGFVGITAGSWLSKKLSKDYKMECYDYGFSYDKELYKPLPKKNDGIIRIGLYARYHTPRRLFELYVLALNIFYKKCQKNNIKVEISFLGQDVSHINFPYPVNNLGTMKIKDIPKVCAENDIFLVPSGTNLSLVPLEVMACKTLAVSNRGENAEWLLNDENSILTDADPIDIAEKLYEVTINKEKREKIAEQGYNFAIKTSWEESGEKVYKVIKNILEKKEEK
ncbi:glycosyltransferase [Leptotrichia trevisanii]|uniref:Glycosyltransferase, group 1 family protein n=1 Tax=Leptotrichia trevisanii TaxID=109328 RepID=A0A510JX97_9FUSO|nr:glycosyltransferase [Leptotrichia trevisanii]BBM44018.1 hypothetical protein JMUB3870_0108 [Leptotrichia trevisanii]